MAGTILSATTRSASRAGVSSLPRHRTWDVRPLRIGLAFNLLVLLPFLVASWGAPRGVSFFGTLKALGDEGVYLAAVREGAQSNWLWHDTFMVHPPPPIFMYPTYLFFGHLGAWLGLSVPAAYALMHVVAGWVLVAALWLLSKYVVRDADRPWLVAFGLLMSGAYWLDALFALFGWNVASLSWMGMPQLSGLTSALMGAHETLGTAGQLLVLAGLLGALGAAEPGDRWRSVAWGSAGTLLVGLTLPMLLPVTVATVGLFTLWWAWQGRSSRQWPALLRASAAPVSIILLPGVLVAVYYYWQLSYGPWAASPLRYTTSRPLVESLLVWGVTIPLGFWGWRAASSAARPLATVLTLWCCCALAGMALPFWQGFRFSTGLNTMTGLLFALAIVRIATTYRIRLRWLMLAGLGALLQLLFLLSILLPGRASALYVSDGSMQALAWLAAHTTQHDVVLAPLGFSNNLAATAQARVVAGHVFLTFDTPLRDRELHTFYGVTATLAARRFVLRDTTARYVVYDANDQEDGAFDPRTLPGMHTVFTDATVAIVQVSGAG